MNGQCNGAFFSEKVPPSATDPKECLKLSDGSDVQVQSVRVFCQIKIIYLRGVNLPNHTDTFHSIWQLPLPLSLLLSPPLWPFPPPLPLLPFSPPLSPILSPPALPPHPPLTSHLTSVHNYTHTLGDYEHKSLNLWIVLNNLMIHSM